MNMAANLTTLGRPGWSSVVVAVSVALAVWPSAANGQTADGHAREVRRPAQTAEVLKAAPSLSLERLGRPNFLSLSGQDASRIVNAPGGFSASTSNVEARATRLTDPGTQQANRCSRPRRALVGAFIGGLAMGALAADIESSFGGGAKAIVPYTAAGAGAGALVGLLTCR